MIGISPLTLSEKSGNKGIPSLPSTLQDGVDARDMHGRHACLLAVWLATRVDPDVGHVNLRLLPATLQGYAVR
jgi:hypothetical protein